ncbi:hypothetical protein IV203_026197 [Nitzschia inconspicua]|uniref:R3H-associated N-terminal domain-containing protein n=1 Tax=Nitzschia inconspicua TaxID=303405 RepID=A0A9K3LIP3_9STRA|nr:hypothetical protein IV203_026197 [Nitzschia inconspicua]
MRSSSGSRQTHGNHHRPTTDDGLLVDNSMELLMRHSSPLLVDRSTATTPRSSVLSFLSPPERCINSNSNTSPSPLRLNRPRSNPRNRTPNRIEEDVNEEEPVERRVLERQQLLPGINNHEGRMEGRRITIRPMAGAAVGTNIAGTRIRETARAGSTATAPARSRKQGPSHRKVRRWNNDNFVNLAAEINKGGGSLAAAEALLLGSSHASKQRSILDPQQHQSKAMEKFRQDDLARVRQQFFNGELPNQLLLLQQPAVSKRDDISVMTPEERFHRIESRLRRVVVKACENSYAASQVVTIFENYLIGVHTGRDDIVRSHEEWLELLLEPPTVTRRPRKTNNRAESDNDNDDDQSELITRFLFDADSSTSGFHRLLLHGVCQFHGLKAVSSTMTVTVQDDKTKKARVLTATGVLAGTKDNNNIGLVDFITKRQSGGIGEGSGTEDQDLSEKETCKLATLQV